MYTGLKNTCTETFALHREHEILEVAWAASQHECGHQLARRALQHEQYLKELCSATLALLNNYLLTHR
jgi:hypothetical protein